jgi:hypothetical protein
MVKLISLSCPKCGQLIDSEEYKPNKRDGAPTATSFDACLRRCVQCGIGFSNAKNPDSVVKIYRNPLDNIPREVQNGVKETLAKSLNKINKNNKKVKFGFETSEDAVTWTVFSHLQNTQIIRESLKVLGVEWLNRVPDEPSLLLWGAPVPIDDQRGTETRNKLIKVLNEIGEDPKKFSEPDVIMDFGDFGIVIIEVKYHSPNDVLNSKSPKWEKYIFETDAFLNISGVKESGYYELARNWRIGWGLSGKRLLVILNLGQDFLFQGSKGEAFDYFCSCLRIDDSHKFMKLTWTKFLNSMQNIPEWFSIYTRNRSLVP